MSMTLTLNLSSRANGVQLALNTLTNFSETMDILANPVKGLILEGPEGFINAIGAGAGGRKTMTMTLATS